MLFDIGGGNGYVAQDIQQVGIPVALVEPGPQGIANAHRRGVQTLICSTLEAAGFQPSSLPAVGLFDVLEHIQDEVGFLHRLFDLMQPGGRIYLTVPAYSWLWSADDDYAGHFRRYTARLLRARLEKAGFRVELATYMFWMLPLPILLLRALPTRLRLRKQNAWNSYQQEHAARKGPLGRGVAALLAWELHRLQAGKVMPLGGSALVVGIKSGHRPFTTEGLQAAGR